MVEIMCTSVKRTFVGMESFQVQKKINGEWIVVSRYWAWRINKQRKNARRRQGTPCYSRRRRGLKRDFSFRQARIRAEERKDPFYLAPLTKTQNRNRQRQAARELRYARANAKVRESADRKLQEWAETDQGQSALWASLANQGFVVPPGLKLALFRSRLALSAGMCAAIRAIREKKV